MLFRSDIWWQNTDDCGLKVGPLVLEWLDIAKEAVSDKDNYLWNPNMGVPNSGAISKHVDADTGCFAFLRLTWVPFK